MDVRHVKPGDPLQIGADTFNLILDSAQDFANRNAGSGAVTLPTTPPDLVLIRNDSGADIARFEILGITGVVFDPEDADALLQFQNKPVLTGGTPVKPDNEGAWVVAFDPIPDGKIGRAVIAGLVPVKIDSVVASPTDKFAEIVDAEAGYLEMNPAGSSRVVFRSPGVGQKWGLVRMGDSAGGGGGFTARLKVCRDAHGIAQVAVLSGYLFSDTEGEDPVEAESYMEVQCPPGLFLRVGGPCYVVPSQGGTPPWAISEVVMWRPRVKAATADPASELIESASEAPYLYDPPESTCE